MSDDFVDEFKAEPVEDEVETPEPAVEAADPPAEPETPAHEEVKPEPEAPVMVPLASVIAEREKRQLAEAKLQAAQAAQEPEPLPDVIDDPEGFAKSILTKTEKALHLQKLNVSRAAAEAQFGTEVINSVMEYYDQNPQLSAQFLDKPSPFHSAVEFYQKQMAVAEIGDPVAYRAKVEAEIRAKLEAEKVAAAVTAPPSLANETSVGGRVAAPPTMTSLDELLA